MVISNTKAKSVYEANGERREWELGFDFDSNVSKLNIILEDAEGYQTIVEDNYLIEDGVVVYPSLESELDPIAEGYKIVLIRETVNNQDIDFRDNLVEKGLDKLTLQIQEIAEEVDRAIKVPVSEEGLSKYKNPVLEIREETKKSLNEIKEATIVVSDYTQASSASANIAKEEADRAVEASNTSVMASADAEASAIEAANLANEAKDAVSAYVNGLGAMRNAVIDLGVFEDNQRRASSCIIDFDFEPLDVFIRFTDSSKNMWINGAHSFAGIEKVGDKKYKIFYSVSSEDFSSQSAIKGPFYVQYVIKYSVFSGKPVMYRGRVDTVDQLPAEAEDGDLWYVGPIEQENKEEYVWQDNKWELLGSTNTGVYYTKEEIDTIVGGIEEEFTTNRNDIDELGDEVAEIESKIPEGTSDTNPLINKQQLLDEEMELREDMMESDSELQTQINELAEAIQGGGGGGSVPDNVYTQDNFIAGKNVTFTEVPPEGGIDEHTIDVFHFEEDSFAEDTFGELGNVKLGFSSGTYRSLTNGKFGKGLTGTSGNNWGFSFNFANRDLNLATPYTLDFWIKPNYSRDYVKLASNIYNWELLLPNNKLALNFGYSGLPEKTSEETLENNVWSHVALTTDGTTFITVYLNGKPCIHQEGGLNVYDGSASGVISANAYGVVDWDEIRISDNIRYTEEFTPPTKPYTLATGPSKTAVNATVPTKLSELENDAGFITGGGSAEIPDNVYTAENLVAGDNITFTPKKAVFNADIVGSPVISDNYEVSGFSDSNYLKFVDPIASASKYDSFEIGFAFKANTLNNDNAGIYDGGSSGYSGYRITITTDGKIRTRIITTSSGSYGINIVGATTLATNKKYYGKVNYSSETGYTLSLKEEGGEWVVDASTTTTTKPYSNGERDIWLGDNQATGSSFDGTIYLPEMYINIDGKRVWTGFLPDRTVVSADNVYTQTNLLGGKDIEIIPEPVEGGIDEYTLGVFHFDDGYTVNAVSGKDALGNQAQMLDSNYAKFGTKSGKGFHDGYNSAYINYYSNTGLTEEGDWTVDHWARFSGSGSKYQASLGVGYLENSYDWWVKFQTDTQMAYVLNNPTGTVVTKASAPITLPINEWVHLAAEKRGNTINGYLNGVKVISFTDSSVRNTLSTRWLETYPYCYIDELRFCTVARYKGEDFTPPTKAYSVAKPTGNMVVNFVGESGGAFDFQGTEAEFNAAVEAGKITDNTVSLVTDDNSGELVATKAELAAVDRSKADTALSNVLANIDYVVESKFPTADDPTWYRKYKSGWVEQGGQVLSLNNGAATSAVTFPIYFVDTNYTLTFGAFGNGFNAGEANFRCTAYSEMGATFYNNSGTAITYKWYACGQGA